MKEAADVTVASSQQSRVDAALAQLGARATGYAVQLFDENAVKTLFARVGPLDHLVYTAGDAVLQSPVREIELEAAEHFFDVRLWGAFPI